MTRYNHFAPVPYSPVNFKSVEIGQKFRIGRFNGKRHIYMLTVKTGDLSYKEVRTQKEHTLFSSDFIVYEYQNKPTHDKE